ncbi:hypothetical protein ACVWXN_006682 [Bradyrhizobium sp. i1.4.4]
MVTTREVSSDDAATVTHMVAALLAELEGGQKPGGLDTQLVVDLLAMKERVYGFLGSGFHGGTPGRPHYVVRKRRPFCGRNLRYYHRTLRGAGTALVWGRDGSH